MFSECVWALCLIIEALMCCDNFFVVNLVLANACKSVNEDGIGMMLPILLPLTKFKKYRFEKVSYR